MKPIPSLPAPDAPGAQPLDAGTTRRPAVRRRLLAASAALLATAAAGCTTLGGGGEPGPSVDAPPPVATGERTYRTLNGYNGEPRGGAVWRFDAAGSRFEGVPYEEAGTGGFGQPIAPLVARQFDAQGRLVAWERADGSRTTFDPPLRVLPFPLVPGQSMRQGALARVDGDPRPRRVVMLVHVGGWQTVDVPAGRFRAVRVTRDLWLGDFEFHRTETRRQEIDWYAPDAGAVVRTSEDSGHVDLLMGRSRLGGGTARRGDWLVRELAPGSASAPVSPGSSRSPSASPPG